MQRLLSIVALIAATLAAPASAQRVDYHKADLIRTSGNFVLGTSVSPRWLKDSVRFYYQSGAAADRGTHYVVDPRTRARQQMFDNTRMVAALSLAADTVLN